MSDVNNRPLWVSEQAFTKHMCVHITPFLIIERKILFIIFYGFTLLERPTKTRPRPTSKPQTTTTMKAFENFGDTPYELPSELTPFSESSENPELIRPEKNRAKDCDCRQICEKINLEKEEPISPTDSPGMYFNLSL